MFPCILMFGSNIVGPTCSREGRAGEAGRRVAEADAVFARGLPEAVRCDASDKQSSDGRHAPVHAEPWPRGSATGAAPSTTAGVGRSDSSTGRSFSCELLSNLACSFVSCIELERLDIDA
jgi:hypothetical protein